MKRRDDARADICAIGFWGRQQYAFFDIRVFHPNTQSYHNSSISSLYPCHQQAKKREYGDSIREVENGSFTPPVFATTGGMGWEATLFYKCLVDEISEKRTPCIARQRHGLDAPYLSPSYDLQLCAFEAVIQDHIEYPMPASNWVSQRASSLDKLYTFFLFHIHVIQFTFY